MTLPRTVADVLNDHVVFEVECIDRMYLNVYVPGLQYEAGLVGFVHRQLGLPIASTAPLGKISDGFSDAMRPPLFFRPSASYPGRAQLAAVTRGLPEMSGPPRGLDPGRGRRRVTPWPPRDHRLPCGAGPGQSGG